MLETRMSFLAKPCGQVSVTSSRTQSYHLEHRVQGWAHHEVLRSDRYSGLVKSDVLSLALLGILSGGLGVGVSGDKVWQESDERDS